MSHMLKRIAGDVARRLEQRQAKTPFEQIRAEAERYSPQDFLARISRDPMNIIAEVKLKSPSEGVIATDPALEPVRIATEYLEAGAAALSVLTEQDHFGGSLDNLRRIRQAHPRSALLMKDFVLDERQLFEARACGADAVLLIVALLETRRTRELLAICRDLHLTALVEVHNAEEMQMAANAGARLIGVNNRDLKTLEVSLEVGRTLAPFAPRDATLVAESGLRDSREIRRLSGLGYRAFLIGTSLMRTQTPGAALARLIKELAQP